MTWTELQKRNFKKIPFNEHYTTVSCLTCPSPFSNIGTYRNEELESEKYAIYDMEEHLIERHNK